MPMEIVSALPFSLHPAPLFSEGGHSQTPFQDESLFVQLSSTIGKRCQPSKNRWEDLKWLIHRVYMEENKTLQQLAEFLRDEHDFFPTDKQLTKRLHDWGFRKNASRKDKIESLPSNTKNFQARSSCKNLSRVSCARFKKELQRRGIAKDVANSSPVTPKTIPTLSTTPESSSFDLDEVDGVYRGEEYQSLTEMIHESLWGSSNSPLQTLLLRLCVALKIQPPDNITAVHLGTGNLSIKKIKRQHFSMTDIMKLTTADQSHDIYLEQNQTSSCWSIQRNGLQPPDNMNGKGALKFPGIDVLFPSDVQVAANPFLELYPFPISHINVLQTTVTSKSRFATCQNEVTEYKEKYTKLERLCAETHPAMINIMEKLGSAYYHLGKASQAEHWYRRAVTARQQTEDSASLKLLCAWLGVIDSTNAQGRFVDAKKLHEEIHPSILRAADADHSIVQKSLQIIALILGNLGNHEDAEEYCRQLVQIRLNRFGLRHGKTISALQRLSNPIRRQERYSESEELLSIMVELSDSAPSMTDHTRCRGLTSLAKVMFKQGRYKESEALHRQAAERSSLSLGEEHPSTLQCVYHLARTLRVQGRLRESEDLLRTTVESQTKILGEHSPSTVDSMSELGETLEMSGYHQEAAVMYEKSLRGFSMIWGPGHDYTLGACESLGRSYEIQHRYTDALALYGRAIDDIHAAHGTNHEAITEIHGWIHRACELWDSRTQ